ncbi:MAG: RNA methyltransferase [Ruminococcaceae bacterium]|nr:RNA methyltransferase [Oscillospiraceae bacterium]
MKKELEKETESAFIEGSVSVYAVMNSGSRDIVEIFLSPDAKKDDGKISGIIRRAKRAGIPVTDCTEEFYEEHSTAKTNGGVLALCSDRKFLSCEELLKKGYPFICLLCGVEDPYNFGYAVRSLYAAGAKGMLLPARNWLSAAGVCVRASAGATEFIDCAVYTDDIMMMKTAKENGYTVVCAEEKDSEDLFTCKKIENAEKILLVIGGEKRGITKDILSNADCKVRIPYGGDFDMSLTASAAASVLGFEILRIKYADLGKDQKTNG